MSNLNPVSRAARGVDNATGPAPGTRGEAHRHAADVRPLTVAVALTKGGVGKTTTAANLAGAAAALGVVALIVDADTQGQAAHALGVAPSDRGPGLAGLVAGTASATEATVEARADNGTRRAVYVLPGGAGLAAEAAKMAADPAAGMLALRDAAAAAAQACGAEFVVFDTPPGWGPLSLGALAAADVVLCPVAPHPLAVEALTEFDRHLATVQRARDAFGGGALPRLAFILPTMFDRRASSPVAVVEALHTWAARHRDRPAVLSPVPYTVRVQEAPAFGELLAEHAPGHPAAEAYRMAAAAVLATVTSRTL